MTLRSVVHLLLHLAVPTAAWLVSRSRRKRAWLIMFAAMLVDRDHLLPDPIYVRIAVAAASTHRTPPDPLQATSS